MSLFDRVVLGEERATRAGSVAASIELPEALYIYLTPQAQAKLKRLVPPAHPQKSGDHLTIAFQPTLAEVERFKKLVGKSVTITATHVVQNDRVQAVKIKDVVTKRGTPHVTISWATGANPAESNDLVARDPGTPLQPWLKLQGVYGFFPGS